MSIKLITGNTFDCVANAVYDEIKANGIRTGRHIVFVPDQFALMNEMAVLDYLGIKSSFNIEVVGFSRLAHRLLRSDKTMLNQQTSVMLLKKIIIDHKNELVCYNRVADKSGYVNELYAVITELRNSGVSPEKLGAVSLDIKGYLKGKLQDITLLYREYIKALATEYTDIGSELELLAERIPELDYITNAHIYVVDFHELTKVKMDILSALIHHCASFTVGVVDCPNAKNMRIYPRYISEFVTREAEKLGLPMEHSEVSDSSVIRELAVVADRVFSYYQSAPELVNNGHYEIRTADSTLSEVRGVARCIRQLIVERGLRYRDISIAVSDMEKYKKEISQTFNDFEIPYYLDDKVALSTTAAAKLMLYAIECVEKNYRAGEVLSFAKSPLLMLTADDICEFELFVKKYNINYSRFTRPFDIGRDDASYECAERVRSVVYNALKVLKSDSRDVDVHIDNVEQFFTDAVLVGYDEYLTKIKAIDERMYDVAVMSVDKMQRTFTEVRDILVGGSYTAGEVYSIISATFDSIEISTVPQYVDGVFVGVENKSKYLGSKVMFLMGAQEGTYPQESDGKGIICVEEAEVLKSKGVEFFPSFKEKTLLSKFLVEQLLLTASDKLVVTYNYQSGEPSIMVSQLKRILNLSEKSLILDSNVAGQNMSYYATKIGSYANSRQELMDYYGERMNGIYRGEEKVFDYLYTKLGVKFDDHYLERKVLPDSIDTRGGVWKNVGDKTFASVSAVESYFNCPFKHFCQKMLGLKATPTGEMDVFKVGSFIHRVLELLIEKYATFEMPNEDLDDIVNGIVANVLEEDDFKQFPFSLTTGGLDKLIYERCRFTARKVVRCIRQSAFNDRNTEISFGMRENNLPPLQLTKGDKIYYMRGSIDRVDSNGDYFVVIDYKTSKHVDFSYKEIFYGSRVQLLLYTNAYMEHSNLKPLAVYYLPLPYDYKKTMEDTNYKYTGFTMNRLEQIKQFDNEYNTEDKVIPITVNKKTGEINEKKLLTADDFDILRKYANDVILGAIEEIESGHIRPKPFDDCGYCEYGAICGVKGDIDYRRKVNTVNLKREEEDE